MEAVARISSCPMSAQKMRLVIDNIRGKDVDVALNILRNTKREAAIWLELELLQKEKLGAKELQKIKNQMQSAMEFSEGGILNKANNLAFYELLGNVDLINTEADIYEAITAEDLQATAQVLYRKENCSVLYYRAKPENE